MLFQPYDFVQISLAYGIWYKHLFKECMERLQTSNVSISNCSTEELLSLRQIFGKNGFFLDQAFYVTIADADIGNLKSLHTLFVKYLEHMLVKFEQNRMVRTIQNYVLFDKKWFTYFDKVLTQFWKTFL